MNLIKRSTAALGVCAALLGVGATPAHAIVGGQDATQTYPGMAALSITMPGLGTAHCGGSLIAPDWVLTAAHCLSDPNAAPAPVALPAANVTIRVGSTNRTAGGVVVTGSRVFLPPDWAWGQKPGRPVADLALVKLDHTVRGVPPLPLSMWPTRAGHTTRLIGWGLTQWPLSPGGTIPTMLQQRDTTVLPAAACADGGIGDGELCIGGGACYGDSGSPALRRIGDGLPARFGWLLLGITSRSGATTDSCTLPSVYTDPGYGQFRAWIGFTVLTGRDSPAPHAAEAVAGAIGQQRLARLKNTLLASW